VIRAISKAGVVSTIAGSAEGFTDGLGIAARFHTPSGLAIDAAGNIYVADTGNHAIRKISRSGLVITLAGSGKPGFSDGSGVAAQFNGPIGVAVDGAGRVFVADSYNDRIRVIQQDGSVSTLAGGDRPGFVDGPGASARFETPTGLAIDRAGTLWVADTGSNAIRRVQQDGSVSTLMRSDRFAAPDALRRPLSVVVTSDGVLYVSEMARGRVLQISAAGSVHVLTGALANQRLARPSALALLEDGSLMVSDAASFRVYRIAPASRQSQLAADVGPATDNPLPQTKQRWPLAPQLGWHEVVGTMGEVRGDGEGMSRHHLHNGLDVRGDVGQMVFAIASAKVSNPSSTWAYGSLNEGIELDGMSYVHQKVGRRANGKLIDPARFHAQIRENGNPLIRVRRGTRFAAGDRLGTLNAFAHIHLSLGVSGYERNPMALGFKDFIDRRAPKIERIQLLDQAQALLSAKENGRVLIAKDHPGLQIVVEAWDQVDNNLARRRLGLYALGLQWLDAQNKPLPGYEKPRMSIEFDRMPLNNVDDHATEIAYATGSGIAAHGNPITRFRYVLSNQVANGQTAINLWKPSALAAGDYVLRITAQDYSGNVASKGRDLLVRIQ
jgi:sugar lactone lactonase YvrE